MSELSERIRWVMREYNLSQAELAKIAGVKQPSVNRWANGATSMIRTEAALKICHRFPISMEWLVNGKGEPKTGISVPVQDNIEPVRGFMKRIPILSYVEAGDPNGIGQIQARQAAIDNGDFIWIDEELPDECFALRVVGHSMEPEFQPGDILVVDPTIKPIPGDFVVASRISRLTNDMETTFKKYRPRGYDEHGREIFELVPLNDDYPKYDSRIEQLTINGVLVEHRRSYRRRNHLLLITLHGKILLNHSQRLLFYL